VTKENCLVESRAKVLLLQSVV